MKICLLNDSFPPVIDGVANVVMNYASILTKSGCEVVVLTPRYPGEDYSKYSYRVLPYQSVSAPEAAGDYRAGNPLDVQVLNEVAAWEPDIIHAHSPVSATYMGRILRELTGAPLIYTYHTKYDIDIRRAIKGEFLQNESIRAIVTNVTACDEVWAVSSGAGENLRSLGYKGPYRVMENGVDFPKGRVADEEVKAVTAGYDLPEDVPVFLFVGRIMKYKGLPLIIDALKKLTDAEYDYRMVFIGSGDDAEELKCLTESLGLAKQVFFIGPVRDRQILRAWNTRADLFLFPSTFDTNGLVVREAAACGLASVLIKGSCAAEGVTDRRNGLLIAEDAEEMAGVLEEICRKPEMAKELGQHAMDEIYQSWDTCVARAKERYQEVLDACGYGEFVVKTSSLYPLREQLKQNAETARAQMQEKAMKTRSALEDRAENAGTGLEEMAEKTRAALEDSVETACEGIEQTAEEAQEAFRQFREKLAKQREDTERDMRAFYRQAVDYADDYWQMIRSWFTK